jgi:pimeloyl-ACP methyl ester carboxylesterase
MADGMGAPGWVPGMLRLMPGVWKRLTAVAHTLPYDAQLVERYQSGQPLPAGQWAAAGRVPVLVMCGTERESPPMLRHAATAVAAAVPGSELVVRRGLGHAKKLDTAAIAATLTEFLTKGRAA